MEKLEEEERYKLRDVAEAAGVVEMSHSHRRRH